MNKLNCALNFQVSVQLVPLWLCPFLGIMLSDTSEWDFPPINKKSITPPSPDPFPDGEKWGEDLKTAPYDPARHMKHLLGYRYIVPRGLNKKNGSS